MPINYALYSGVSGLATNADGMSVISNNIANANTKAYKTDRAEFEDLFGVSVNEGSLIGRGARLRNTSTIFNQGALTNTGQVTDMSIQGDGFFEIKSQVADVKVSNGFFYTRQGSFHYDRDGFLVDPTGGRVQGYMPDTDNANRLSVAKSDLQIIKNTIPPKATSIVNIVANLDVREKSLGVPFDITHPADTSNFGTSVNIYDNYGYGRQSTIYFARTPDVTKNEWNWYMTIDGNEVSTNPARDETGKVLPAQIAQGKVEFDGDGKPILPFQTKLGQSVQIDLENKTDAFDVQFVNGAKAQKIQVNLGPQITDDKSVGAQSSTSIAASSGVVFHSQDGFEAGYLKTLKIDPDGMIRGTFTNGLERKLGAIAVASFQNNQGLAKVGRNNYIATPKAGEAHIGLAQTGTRGSVYSASLEESNVDLAQQFVDMIITQRGFQANSKSITTTDTMLDEIINLKR